MTTSEMLTLSSEEFHFNAPYTQASEVVVNFGNRTGNYLAFKVRTMEPKMYTVKPSSGLILPGETIPVKITFQGMKSESAFEEFLKTQQQFQLQYREIYQFPSVADTAHSLMKPDKEGGPLYQKLVSCRFDIPEIPEEANKDSQQAKESFEDTQDTHPPPPPTGKEDESAKKPKNNSPPSYRSLREKEKKMLSSEEQQKQQQQEEQPSNLTVDGASAVVAAAAAAAEDVAKETGNDAPKADSAKPPEAAKDTKTANNEPEVAATNKLVDSEQKAAKTSKPETVPNKDTGVSPNGQQLKPTPVDSGKEPQKKSEIAPRAKQLDEMSPGKEQQQQPKSKPVESAAKPHEVVAVSPATQNKTAPDKDYANKEQQPKQNSTDSSAKPPKKSEPAPGKGLDASSANGQQQQEAHNGNQSDQQIPNLLTTICALLVALFAAYILFG